MVRYYNIWWFGVSLYFHWDVYIGVGRICPGRLFSFFFLIYFVFLLYFVIFLVIFLNSDVGRGSEKVEDPAEDPV